MRRQMVAGNWKMNGSTGMVKELCDALKADSSTSDPNITTVVFPPFVYLSETRSRLQDSSISWGGQTLSAQGSGAFTGEVSADMLLDMGCRYVLVGHSERRTLYGETDQMVAEKYAAARKAGLVPVLCVGETLQERETDQTEAVIDRQLKAVIDLDSIQGMRAGVIAYEPVWAIGTGKTATPEQAQAVHRFIRGKLATYDATIADSMIILYGGSVKGDNASDLFGMPDIDGGLVGGASLKAQEFLKIVRSAL